MPESPGIHRSLDQGAGRSRSVAVALDKYGDAGKVLRNLPMVCIVESFSEPGVCPGCVSSGHEGSAGKGLRDWLAGSNEQRPGLCVRIALGTAFWRCGQDSPILRPDCSQDEDWLTIG